MIDEKGYRLNVGIVLANAQGQLFWGKRVGLHNAWQFPQGGIMPEEDPLTAMYRELSEEIGLNPSDVEVIGISKDWLHYHLPKHLRRHSSKPLCIGQKQKWFLLKLISGDDAIHLNASAKPEFESWQWVDYWHPLRQVVMFKRQVYQQILTEFEKLLMTSAK